MPTNTLYISDSVCFCGVFGVESFCGVCRTELIYDLWQVFVFIPLIIVVPVGIMSVMYICSIRTIRKKACT